MFDALMAVCHTCFGCLGSPQVRAMRERLLSAHTNTEVKLESDCKDLKIVIETTVKAPHLSAGYHALSYHASGYRALSYHRQGTAPSCPLFTPVATFPSVVG